MFNNTWIWRYLHPRKVVFDNESKFKRDFTPLLNDLNIEPIWTSIKNPQYNTPVERVQRVILNMLVTKDLDNKVFDHIDPWGETFKSIAWTMRDFYHRTIMTMPVQVVLAETFYSTSRQSQTSKL